MDSELETLLRRLRIAPQRAWEGLHRALTFRPVDSHAAREIGYRPQLRLMGVVFSGDDALYLYPDTSPHEWMHALAAPSLGRYLNHDFKPRHRDHIKVEAPVRE